MRVEGAGFAIGTTMLPYVHGVNYEGPDDQAWHMWAAATFSPSLIAADFDHAVQAGYDPIRIFVQPQLSAQVLAGNFTELDTVVALARARGLHLLVTFNDDHSGDLATVARVNALIAAHLADETAIFGYDVENEPGIAQIATATYPTGIEAPLEGAGAAALAARYATPFSPVPGHVNSGPGGRTGIVGGNPGEGFDSYASMRALLARFQMANPNFPEVAASSLLATIRGRLQPESRRLSAGTAESNPWRRQPSSDHDRIQ